MAMSEQEARGRPEMAQTLACLPKSELWELAETRAKACGQSFTTLRRHVYQVLLDADEPLGAYDILATLEGVASMKPVNAYRALDWLRKLGLVCKIRAIHKYVALPTGSAFSPVAFLICKECGLAEQLFLGKEWERFLKMVEQRGYSVPDAIVEVTGYCTAHDVKEQSQISG